MATAARNGLDDLESPLTIVVVGASGDLARKKVFPALFALFCQDFLPQQFQIVGFARTPMSRDDFRERVIEHLTCRYAPEQRSPERMDEFLSRCWYVSGQYDSVDAYLDVYACMRGFEEPGHTRRVYYMAIPPFLFLPVAHALGKSGLVNCDPEDTWPRAVIEKPFGTDRQSSDKLVADMAQVFTEHQTFRIDHYLGKEVIQDLIALRFANRIFAPLWSKNFIESVEICWTEDIGVEDRGGYFDSYGIIRDVMQNHLLQILALVAMEQPRTLSAQHVRNEKVRVLRAVPPLELDDLVIGQYGPAPETNPARKGYREEKGVPEDSRTCTFAAAALRVNTPRWEGVPFFIRAGKALDSRLTEIRIRFKPVENDLFVDQGETLQPNELVVRVQPGEAISLRVMNKLPGLGMRLVQTELDCQYHSRFETIIPDAYECLILEVVRGDKSLFIRADELEAAWDVFTPALHRLETGKVEPELYPFGSSGPEAAQHLFHQCRKPGRA
jgi:glucose-6-phosphate 1-dehydrogenase